MKIRKEGGRNLIPSLWKKHCSVLCTASNQALEVRGTWEPVQLDYVVARLEGPGNPPGSNILASMELGSEVRVALKKTDNNCTVTGISNNPYF